MNKQLGLSERFLAVIGDEYGFKLSVSTDGTEWICDNQMQWGVRAESAREIWRLCDGYRRNPEKAVKFF